MLDTIVLNKIEAIARDAGDEIMKIYEKDFQVDYKDDKSPLTEADTRSNEIICSRLEKEYPEIPILSEEGKNIPYEERREWGYFWLIDPIDGTKEFIKKNGEFTVNIALVHQGIPVLGVVKKSFMKGFLSRWKKQLRITFSWITMMHILIIQNISVIVTI